MQANDLIQDGGVTWKVIDTRKSNITVHNATGTDSLNPMSQAAVTTEVTNLQRQINGTPTSEWSVQVGNRLDSLESAFGAGGLDSLVADAAADIQAAVNSANSQIQTALANLDTTNLWTTDRLWVE